MSLKSIVSLAAATAIASAAISVVAISASLAQDPHSVQSNPVQAVMGCLQSIDLILGKGRLCKTLSPYAKLSVADEKTVEVTPQSDREFIVNARGIGSTNVFVFDDKNMLIATFDVNVVAGNEKAKQSGQEVRIYNQIYDAKGMLAKPAFYQCSRTDCELGGEAPAVEPSPGGRITTSRHGDATPEAAAP